MIHATLEACAVRPEYFSSRCPSLTIQLAISRLLVKTAKVDQFKVVMLAPIKALCNERLLDWERRLSPLGLKVAALTGDSNSTEGFQTIVSAQILLTTPEKVCAFVRQLRP